VSTDWEPPAFTSRAPLAEAAARNAAAILVVDDKEAVRASVADVLRIVGYTVIESGDGLDALRLLSAMRFEAMVLDLRLPRLGGAELLGRVPRPPPTVVLSAVQLGSDAMGQVGPAVIAQLRKPVAPQFLIDAVAAAVAVGMARRAHADFAVGSAPSTEVGIAPTSPDAVA
jgi:DNA-binding NtrC family response regulator